MRLQTKTPSSSRPTDKPRPIKVEFPDETSRWEFIRRANATLRQSNTRAKPDESKEKRDQQYALRQKIKELKSVGDTDAEYRIRSLQIQKKRLTRGNGK